MAYRAAIVFFLWLAACHASFVIFALWRMLQRAPLPSDQQGPFVAAPFQGSEMSTICAEEASNSQALYEIERR